MRKQDLKVGEEYAAGSTSRYDRWRLARVRLVELDGVREVKGAWNTMRKERGIVVALMEDRDEYLMRGKTGDEKVLPSARDIIEPWASYADLKAKDDASAAANRAERERVRKVGEDVMARMVALGGLPGVKFSDGVFRVPADKMAAIIARIPDGHDAG